MAKGNILLGTSTGSIGDVPLSRRNGRQVQRVRVRTIANPKSEAQGAQRMRMAAITRFYSPLATCLEKAFENKNRSESYSKYLSINAKKAAADNFAVPKDGGLAPIPVQISAGTLPTPVVAAKPTDDVFALTGKAATAPTTFGALSTAIINQYGLQNGDQVTFVAVFAEDDKGNYSVEYHRVFLDSGSTAELSTLSVGRLSLTGAVNELTIADANDNLAAIGVVFSRWQAGKWRRSNSVMVCQSASYYGDAAYHQFIDGWTAAVANAPAGTVYLDGNGSVVSETMFRYVTDRPHLGDAIEIASLGYATVPAATVGNPDVENVLVAFDSYGVAHPFVVSDVQSDLYKKGIKNDDSAVDVKTDNAVVLPVYDSTKKQAYDTMYKWFIAQGIEPDVVNRALVYRY